VLFQQHCGILFAKSKGTEKEHRGKADFHGCAAHQADQTDFTMH